MQLCTSCLSLLGHLILSVHCSEGRKASQAFNFNDLPYVLLLKWQIFLKILYSLALNELLDYGEAQLGYFNFFWEAQLGYSNILGEAQ